MQTKLKVTLLTHTPNAEETIATAAKLCYSPDNITEIRDNLTPEGTEKFLNLLMDMGHESPIEHVSFTFGIEGVSRSLTHQLVRHRLASYSQKSQRYVREGQFEYVVPPQIAGNDYATELYIENMERAQEAYDEIAFELLAEKIRDHIGMDAVDGEDVQWFKSNYGKLHSQYEKEAIEDARYVLPNACETKIIATFNARELLHLFKVRCCNRAQWEIRYLAYEMLMWARQAAPTLFKHAGPNCLNKPCPEGNMTCGKMEEVREQYKC